jgi:hypothetical protein
MRRVDGGVCLLATSEGGVGQTGSIGGGDSQ